MPGETAQTAPRTELPNAGFIFGSTARMREIREKVELALQDDLPVLVEGESGTGKEVLARFLHNHSDRRTGPFVKVNCGAVATDVLDGEMFGCESPAVRNERSGMGSIEMASGGVMFIDEVGAMDLDLQRKVARTFETGLYQARGTKEDLTVTARLICATSFDSEIDAGSPISASLRSCCVHRVHLVPLRERKEDIPNLCEFLLEKFARAFGRPVPHLSRYVLETFQLWKWPGNVRELENWIARIVIFGSEEAIGLEFNRQLAKSSGTPRPHRATRTIVGRTRRLRK